MVTVTITISGSLISHVRKLFWNGLQSLASGNMLVHLIEMIPETEEEYQRRGLEKDIPYGRFKSFQDNVQNGLKDLTQIDEGMRDHLWAEAGIATKQS